MYKGEFVPHTLFDAPVFTVGLVALMDGRFDGNWGHPPGTSTHCCSLHGRRRRHPCPRGAPAVDLKSERRLAT